MERQRNIYDDLNCMTTRENEAEPPMSMIPSAAGQAWKTMKQAGKQPLLMLP